MRFYNCVNTYISTKYQNKNKVSIKIFTNGNIQLAGILNVTSATYTIRKIFKRLKNINAFSNEREPYISNVRICMINSDFKIDKNIKQAQLCKIIDENDYSFIKRYSFIPSKYPGINIKIAENEEDSKCITCSVFRPGSIIITGGNDLNIYKQTLENLLFILKNNNNVLY
jgi:TATA-box binding protein (TBP) (component of TFIID and TFIIIB)